MIVLIFSIVEPSFADLSAEISPTNANVGDTVTITITASNDELSKLVSCNYICSYTSWVTIPISCSSR